MKHDTKHDEPKGILRRVAGFVRNRNGNVAALFGILLIPLVAALAVGTEVAGWLVEHRAEQNAASRHSIYEQLAGLHVEASSPRATKEG